MLKRSGLNFFEGTCVKKELPENEEGENEEVFPDWSNIDATSIYRAGSDQPVSTEKPELDKLVKETNNFFKIGIIMLIILFVVIIVSSYY
jgi:hypothetical protein